MRYWLFAGLLALTACGNDDNDSGDSDNKTDDDTPNVETATCDDLYDRTNGCLDTRGCADAFIEDEYVTQCEGAGFTARELGEIVSQTCDDVLIPQCLYNEGLFSLECCQSYFVCSGGTTCGDVQQGVGICLVDGEAPSGADSCTRNTDCASAEVCSDFGGGVLRCTHLCIE